MSFSTLLICFAGLIQLSIAGYALEDDYTPSNFFSMFQFFTDSDPTNGFVQYVDETKAHSSGLVSTSYSSVYMGVDHTNVTPNGRPSVRLTSNKAYDHGLIILDIAHMPEGCGTWPAFWTVGPEWPKNGEIDIIEGVNAQTTNAMTLHTGPSCSITHNNAFTGTIQTSDCNVNDPNQANNAGCGISTTNTQTYGRGLNSINGGVFATEWTSQAISVYFFPRSSIPSDITGGTPDPASWGKPLSQFQGSCDMDSSMKSQKIVFDTTFCGDWAGNVWSSSSCASKAPNCQAFVENNPSAFADAYWTVNSLKVYQDTGASSAHLVPGNAVNNIALGIASPLPAALSSAAPIPAASTQTSVIHVTAEAQATSKASSSSSSSSTLTTAPPSQTPNLITLGSDGGVHAAFNVQAAAAAAAAVSSSTSSSTTKSISTTPAPTPSTSSTSSTSTSSSSTSAAAAAAGTGWQPGQPLLADFFAPNGGIPVNSKRSAMEEERDGATSGSRRHARHLLAHRRSGSGMVVGKGGL